MDYTDFVTQTVVNNRRVNSVIKDFAFITESRVIYYNTELVKYIDALYYKSMQSVLMAYWHNPVTLIAIITAIVKVVIWIYNKVVWIVDVLKLKELLQIADVLAILWPDFRNTMNKIYGKVAEFSASIGWGADGLAHLINAAQSGVGIVAGMFNKSTEWAGIFGADRAIHALNLVSLYSAQITKDPGMLLDLAFRGASQDIQREVKTKFSEVTAWLENTTGKATLAIQQVNETIDNLQDLENRMPQMVKDFIPVEVFDAIRWVDEKIDNTILPVLTNLNDQLPLHKTY